MTAANAMTKGVIHPQRGVTARSNLRAHQNGTSLTVANSRTYDAWGGIRTGVSTGNPQQRYCANLSHRADDETGGLI